MTLLLVSAIVGVGCGLYVSRVAKNFVPAARAETIVIRRPVPQLLVQAVVAALFVAMAWRFGPSWILPVYLFFAVAGMLLALIDIQHHLLPNVVLIRALAIGAALLVITAAFGDDWQALLRAILGGMLLFALYLMLALISPASMGMGDVKLAAFIGVFLAFEGWETLFWGAAAGFVAGALFSMTALLARRGGLKSAIPFGPPMLVGAVVGLLL